jgi:hypothetical protein
MVLSVLHGVCDTIRHCAAHHTDKVVGVSSRYKGRVTLAGAIVATGTIWADLSAVSTEGETQTKVLQPRESAATHEQA